jgi:hypothetical protein
VNPTGKFVIGGPDGDAGLTGRKIIVDTYGGAAPHGGGAFSGKDPTKVDRSAAYAARYLAKNVVAAGLAKRCTIQLSYAIGVAQPLSIYADTHGTGEVPEAGDREGVGEIMDLTPRGIRTHLQLNRPIYQRTAAYGHFGRAPEADGGFLVGTDGPRRGAQGRRLTGRSSHGRPHGPPASQLLWPSQGQAPARQPGGLPGAGPRGPVSGARVVGREPGAASRSISMAFSAGARSGSRSGSVAGSTWCTRPRESRQGADRV